MTKEDIELVIKWFANIEQLATDRKNANGIVMDTTAVLTTIRTKAKACKEYVQMFGGEQEQPEVELKKGIDAFFDKWDKNSYGCIFDELGAPVTIETIKSVVKRFLNARERRMRNDT